MTLDCSPTYDYTPNFTASDVQCTAPNYNETRSRLTIGGGFFRSVEMGDHTNNIAVEANQATGTFKVYYGDEIVETYSSVLFGPGGLAELRDKLSNSEYIQMPSANFDVHDTRTEDDTEIGLTEFSLTFFSGGSGLPSTRAGRNTIRTGPERTIGIIQNRENLNGTLSLIGPIVKEWNGTEWVEYSENSDCREV